MDWNKEAMSVTYDDEKRRHVAQRQVGQDEVDFADDGIRPLLRAYLYDSGKLKGSVGPPSKLSRRTATRNMLMIATRQFASNSTSSAS
jgi:hypothetical protein